MTKKRFTPSILLNFANAVFGCSASTAPIAAAIARQTVRLPGAALFS
ncbi:hypothetical protein EDD52_12430 [Primorskyibacter sedentarius]|uniref:Uncharacterized protein n=1 Tax=Primorskyibacter sedentarius TaxID=745311 RepID=A0A4V2UN09_9RHOB|nr:hypothetical protein EDD52_12430 [Primorskyibacter sedentarius]